MSPIQKQIRELKARNAKRLRNFKGPRKEYERGDKKFNIMLETGYSGTTHNGKLGKLSTL